MGEKTGVDRGAADLGRLRLSNATLAVHPLSRLHRAESSVAATPNLTDRWTIRRNTGEHNGANMNRTWVGRSPCRSGLEIIACSPKSRRADSGASLSPHDDSGVRTAFA
jgi:hypothetical protein